MYESHLSINQKLLRKAGQNLLLAALPDDEYQELSADLELINIKTGEDIYDAGQPINYVYFPSTSLISVFEIMEDGAVAEIEMIGRFGVVGVQAIFGVIQAINRTKILITGDVLRINASTLREFFSKSESFSQLLTRYYRAHHIQISRRAICNLRHKLSERLSTWMLMAQDARGSSHLPVTQELLANCLGTRRASITTALAELQSIDAINYVRGSITISDRLKLETNACECYKIISSAWEGIFANLPASDSDLSYGQSKLYNVPSINLDLFNIDETVIRLIPRTVAEEYSVLPLSRVGATLTLAMVDPANVLTMDHIKHMTGLNIEPVAASEADIHSAIALYYSSDLQKRYAELSSRLEKAEEIAMLVEQDFIVLTHQLQGPLSSAIMTLNLIKREPLEEGLKQKLRFVEAIIEDAHTTCYGIIASFAQEMGRQLAFHPMKVNAAQELRKLAKRLQATNSRQDLRFEFYEDPEFPILKVDRDVLSSVFYNLLHNVMKYADKNSAVGLECNVDRRSPVAKIKVKSVGEPIRPGEKELIFQKYQRGEIVQKTGRHHVGSGLGLWVARELMRSIGGDLTVELSMHDPRYSVFVVHIPLPSMQLPSFSS